MKAVLFDMDGVLVDSVDAWHALFNNTLTYFGKKPISKEVFLKNVWSMSLSPIRKKFFDGANEKVTDQFLKKRKILIEGAKQVKDAKSTLAKLKKRGYSLGVATNTFSLIAHELLKKHRLFDAFDCIVCRDEVKIGKPNPQMLIRCIKLLNADPKQSFMIGDTNKDLIAANGAGVPFVGIGMKSVNSVSSLKQLLKIIK